MEEECSSKTLGVHELCMNYLPPTLTTEGQLLPLVENSSPNPTLDLFVPFGTGLA